MDKYSGGYEQVTSAVGIEGKSFIVPNVPTSNPAYNPEYYISQGWHTNDKSTVAQLIPQTSSQFGRSRCSEKHSLKSNRMMRWCPTSWRIFYQSSRR